MENLPVEVACICHGLAQGVDNTGELAFYTPFRASLEYISSASARESSARLMRSKVRTRLACECREPCHRL